MSDLIPTAEVLALIGRKQIPNGFPRSVHRQRRGNPAMYDRAAVERWHAADERKKADRAARRKAKEERAAAVQIAREQWFIAREQNRTERERQKAERERRRAAVTRAPTRAPCWPPDEDFPSRIRLSDKPGLDGIDVPAAVLAAERRRDRGEEKLHRQDRWAHLTVDPFAKPDAANIARSEAINARLPGGAKPEKPAARISLPERVTEPGFRSARAPRLQTVALVVGPRPQVARPSNPRFPAPPNGRPQRMAAPTTHAVSAGG